MASNDELACTYSALILADDEVPVTADKLATIMKAANYKYEPYWPGLFAKALNGIDIKKLISNVGSGAPAAGGSAPAAGGAAPAAEEEKKEEKKESEDEESDDDMGFGLFD